MGFGWTTKDCYDYIDAQANLAVGDYQTACEILHSNPATERARRRGAKIADCALLVQRVEYVDQCGPQCNAEVLLRIEHAIAEYIETHPTPECPKPKPHHSHVTCKMQPVINVPPATVVQPSKIDVDVNVKQDRRTPGLDAPPPR
jgi:hypothetical protein